MFVEYVSLKMVKKTREITWNLRVEREGGSALDLVCRLLHRNDGGEKTQKFDHQNERKNSALKRKK